MKLSKNYSLSEFERSAKAKELGIDNTAPASVVNRLRILVNNLLQPISDATGWANIISSGYREARVNRAVGGSSTSQHLMGEASDNKFYYRGKDGKASTQVPIIDVAEKVVELGLEFDQMILYPTFLHLSFKTDPRKKNRNQVLYNKAYRGPKLLLNK